MQEPGTTEEPIPDSTPHGEDRNVDGNNADTSKVPAPVEGEAVSPDASEQKPVSGQVGEPIGSFTPLSPEPADARRSFMTTTTTRTVTSGGFAETETTTVTEPVTMTAPYAGPSSSFPRPVG